MGLGKLVDPGCTHRDEDVDVRLDQLLSETGESIVVPRRRPPLDDKVLAFHIPEIPEAEPERLVGHEVVRMLPDERRRPSLTRRRRADPRAEHPDAWHPRRNLCRRRVRQGLEGQSDSDSERSMLHVALVRAENSRSTITPTPAASVSLAKIAVTRSTTAHRSTAVTLHALPGGSGFIPMPGTPEAASQRPARVRE